MKASSSVAGQTFLEQRRHRTALAQRKPEVTLDGSTDEAPELDIKRLVEAEVRAQPCPVFLGRVLADHERDRIAGVGEQGECDKGHGGQDRDRLQDATEDEGEHRVKV